MAMWKSGGNDFCSRSLSSWPPVACKKNLIGKCITQKKLVRLTCAGKCYPSLVHNLLLWSSSAILLCKLCQAIVSKLRRSQHVWIKPTTQQPIWAIICLNRSVPVTVLFNVAHSKNYHLNMPKVLVLLCHSQFAARVVTSLDCACDSTDYSTNST